MHACMYECIYACMYECIYVCMYECIYVCKHACMYACMHECLTVRKHVPTHVCMHVWMYVWIHASGAGWMNHLNFSKSIPALLSKVPLKIKIFENGWLALIEKPMNNKNMNFHEDPMRESWSKIGGTERMNRWNFSKSIPALLSKVPLKIKIFENEWLALIEKLINNKNMNFHEDPMRGSWSKIGGTEMLMEKEKEKNRKAI